MGMNTEPELVTAARALVGRVESYMASTVISDLHYELVAVKKALPPKPLTIEDFEVGLYKVEHIDGNSYQVFVHGPDLDGSLYVTRGNWVRSVKLSVCLQTWKSAERIDVGGGV